MSRTFQVVGTAEERAHFAGRNLRVRRDDSRDLMVTHHELQRADTFRQPLARLAIEIRDDVAEPIDAHDLTAQHAILELRLRQIQEVIIRDRASERREMHALGQPCRGRRPGRPT